MLKFSIVMPVKNGAQFMSAAIESIRSQDHEHWDLQVLDANSEDGSSDIASKFAQNDPRITHIREADDGMYDAILKGLAQSDGAWCSWLNADDMLTPWAMATVCESTKAKSNLDWVTGYPSCWDAQGRLCYARPQALYPQRLIRDGWFREGLLGYLQQESMFFSRRLFEKLNAQSVEQIRKMNLAGDFLMWREFAEHATLHPIPSVLGGFRRHDANMSTKHAGEYKAEVLATNPARAIPIISPVFSAIFRIASARAMLRSAARADDEMTITSE